MIISRKPVIAVIAAAWLSVAAHVLAAETSQKDSAHSDESSAGASADTSGKGADLSKIDPEKKALIKEIITLSDAHKRTEMVSDNVFAQSEKNFISGMSTSIGNNTEYTDSQKTELITRLTLSSARFFDRCRELMKQRINLAEIVDSVMYPIYDKYFSADDLKQLVGFYKSPIGEKFVKLMPQIYQESSAKTNEILIPRIQAVIRQAAEEEKANLKGATSN